MTKIYKTPGAVVWIDDPSLREPPKEPIKFTGPFFPATSVWLCGRWVDDREVWDVLGLYTTAAKARAACHRLGDFVAEVDLDKPLPMRADHPKGTQWPVGGIWGEG